MSTSGSYDWSLTAQGIINDVAENLGVVSFSGTPTTAFTTSALSALNRITKALSAAGLRVWTIQWVTQTFSAPSEIIGTDTKNYTCIYPHTGAAATYPITGANYSSMWYQSGSAGVAHVVGTSYTASGVFSLDDRVLSVISANIRETDTDTPIEVCGFDRYFQIEDKWRTGKPELLAIDKKFRMGFLWPQPDASDYDDYVLHMLVENMLEDFDNVANDPDWISLYNDYIVKELTYAMAPKANKIIQERALMKAEAKEALRVLQRKEAPRETSRMNPSHPLPRGRHY